MDKIEINEIIEGEYRLFVDPKSIVFLHKNHDKLLKINKNTHCITEEDQSLISNLDISAVYKPHAILGIISINTKSYILYVEKCEIVGIINSNEIFKILKTNMIPLYRTDKGEKLEKGERIEKSIEDQKEQTEIEIKNINNLLTTGFYYSFYYDLTNSKQKQFRYATNFSNSTPDLYNNVSMFENVTYKFYWNYHISKSLIDAKVHSIWRVICIFGYVNIKNLQLSGESVQLSLISRRSLNNSGTYSNTKGITNDGHVANYVETEHILNIKQKLYSWVIIRGSPPIFFEEDFKNQTSNYGTNLIIKRNTSNTTDAFLLHLNEIQKEFKYVMMMNLMNELNQSEQLVSVSFKSQFEINEINQCKYHQFDLYNNCKKDDFSLLEKYIDDNLLNIIINFKFFSFYKERFYTADFQDEDEQKETEGGCNKNIEEKTDMVVRVDEKNLGNNDGDKNKEFEENGINIENLKDKSKETEDDTSNKENSEFKIKKDEIERTNESTIEINQTNESSDETNKISLQQTTQEEANQQNEIQKNIIENKQATVDKETLIENPEHKDHKDNHCYTREFISEQIGVFRINCLDCLDRTNIFQSRICWQILLNIVK